ncbi:MAG: glycosyl hydrolase family 65 protein, partial [Ginsengibacter sp.]
EGNQLKFTPCIPGEWKSFKAHYRYKNTVYHIEVMQIPTGEKMTVTVNGVEKEGNIITLVDDGAEHNVLVAANKNI